ncbi:MAG: nitroreductase family protein [Verrucomicrobiales bacterium]|nr:nitroreductase family protein [Verrucomicrobiales bacterium]
MKPPLDPWQVVADEFPADSYASDQLEFLLAYAVLAPSNHNTQPWLFRINATDVEVHADRRRAIRVIDPYDRELTLSAGAALFNLRVAAEYFGHHYEVELLPDPDDKSLLARFRLGLRADTGAEDVLLFHAIAQRHTNREPFAPDPLPEELGAALQEAAASEGAWLEFVDGEEARNGVADLVAEADRRQWADRHFRQELAHWVRPKHDAARDGIPVQEAGVQDWLSFAGPLLIRTFDRGGGMAAKDRDIALHAPVLALLGTEQENRASWLAAGQALQHVLLKARTENVSASFLCQPVEVPELRSQLAALVGREEYPQVLLRLGYGPEVPPAPRRSPREMLIQHATAHT